MIEQCEEEGLAEKSSNSAYVHLYSSFVNRLMISLADVLVIAP